MNGTDVAGRVVALLTAREESVATAESLTGGLVVAALVDVPGASRVVRGGVVAYATEVKHTVLRVDAGLLAAHGPVHPEVAAQLAAGACVALGADWGLATTGVAGPGPQDGVPAGTVHIAVHGPDPGQRAVRSLWLPGARAQVRRETVEALLALFAELLTQASSGHVAEPPPAQAVEPSAQGCSPPA